MAEATHCGMRRLGEVAPELHAAHHKLVQPHIWRGSGKMRLSCGICAGLEDMAHGLASRNPTDEVLVCSTHGGQAVGGFWWVVLHRSMYGRWTQPCVIVGSLPVVAL